MDQLGVVQLYRLHRILNYKMNMYVFLELWYLKAEKTINFVIFSVVIAAETEVAWISFSSLPMSVSNGTTTVISPKSWN